MESAGGGGGVADADERGGDGERAAAGPGEAGERGGGGEEPADDPAELRVFSGFERDAAAVAVVDGAVGFDEDPAGDIERAAASE